MFLASDAPISPNTNGPFDDFWYGPVGTMSASGIRVGPEQAKRLAAVYGCVKVISESTAMLPAILYRRMDERTKQRATEHPLYKLLRRRPNPWQTAMEWREMMQAHVLLSGMAYSEIVTARNGDIEALLPLHPDCMKPDILGPGRFRWLYQDRVSGQARPLLREEVFVLRGLSSNGIMGRNPIEEQRDTIGMGLAAQDYGARFFQNDATPPGWIEHPAHFKDEEAQKKFKQSWQESQTGRNRGKTAVLQYGMKYHQVEIKNTDAQFLESRKFSVEEICRIFRVPPHKIQDLSHATFCLPGDALVSTANGPKPIADIVEGEQVWSLDAENSWVLSRVTRSEVTGEDEIITLRCRNRTLRCNARHRVAVWKETMVPFTGGRGKWIEVDGQRFRHGNEMAWVPAGEIEPGDLLIAVDHLPEKEIRSCQTRESVSAHDNARIGSHTDFYNTRISARIEAVKKREVAMYPSEHKRRFVGDGLFATRVIEIERGEREPVYDLCVADTHNFVADLMLVHNSNVEHLGLQFVTDTLMPWLIRWEQAIDRDLLPEESEDELFVEFLVDALLRGDIKSRYDAYRSGIQAGWLTRNEARVKENMDPLEGLDEPLEPLNMGRAGDARPDGQRSTDGADDQTADDSQAPTEQHGRAQILARAAAERVIRGEVAAMRKAYAVAIGDPESFPDAVEKFYAEHADYVATVMLCDRITARDWCDRQSAAILRAADVEIEQQQPMVPALLEAWSETSADELAAFVEGTRRVDTLPALIERQTEAQVKRLTETVAAGFDRLATTSNDTARVLGAVGGGVERLGETLRETAERQIAQMKVTGEAITSVGNHAQASGELQSAKLDQVRNDIQAGQAQITDGLARVAAEIARPSKPVFDDKGNVIGVKKVDSLDR